MSLAGALGAYAALNAALVVAALGLAAMTVIRRRGARAMLSLNYLVFAALVLSLLTSMLLPDASFIQPSARIWSTEVLSPQSALPPSTAGWISIGTGETGFDAGSVGRVWIATALALLALGLIALGRDLARLRKIHRHSHRIRRIGRVSVWINDTVAAPFSYWRPGRAHVVLPAYLVEQPAQLRVVIAHELQHHRQRDTVWLHAFRVLQLVCFANPFAYLWARQISRLQELACDEAVVARPAFPVESYARCLLDVATRGSRNARSPSAAAFIGFGDPKFLIRRIETMMTSRPPQRSRRPLALVACFAAAMTSVAFAAGNWIQDRRVTTEQAEQLLARMPVSTELRIVINDEVLAELNRYAGTAQGREFMRAALVRSDEHSAIVATALARHHVPAELAAVPIVESGYANLDQTKNRLKGAGIWQFIPGTARAFGLRVDGTVDDRMNPAMLSDAAARMLHSDKLRFGDWQLALLAFNAGGTAVQQGIDSTGSRDAWTLVRAGIGGDRGYLARVHAAMIIAANPDMVKP